MNRAEATDLQNFDFAAFQSFLKERDISTFVEQQDVSGAAYADHISDAQTMAEIVARVRKQLRFILHAVRCWQERHDSCDDLLRLRYSAYEGSFCYADLRRHWAYYRHAMREYHDLIKKH